MARVNGDELLDKTAGDKLLLEVGKGKPCPSVLLRRTMRTKTTKQLTVHLDDSDVQVRKVGSLLSIANENGDVLHVFLSVQGWEQLRETVQQRAAKAADS